MADLLACDEMTGPCYQSFLRRRQRKKRKEEWDGLVAAMGSVEDAREVAEHEAKVAAGVLPL